MYVSSYNTYIDTTTTDKTRRERSQDSDKSTSSFSVKPLAKTLQTIDISSQFPVNYISKYKALNNQQRLKDDTLNSDRAKFSKVKALVSSKSAYSESSKIFPLLLKTSVTLNQTPQIDKRMPINTQEAKEKIMKHTMINTYTANDNYYRITAA